MSIFKEHICVTAYSVVSGVAIAVTSRSDVLYSIQFAHLLRTFLFIFDAVVVGIMLRLMLERRNDLGALMIDLTLIIAAIANAFAAARLWDSTFSTRRFVLEIVWLAVGTCGVLLALHHTRAKKRKEVESG